MSILRLFIISLLFGCVVSCQQKQGMIEQLMRESDKFDHILENVEKYKLQIIYTQIYRDENNKANFTTFKFRVDDQQYFYPASSIKLPVAALALEKINNLDIDGLTTFSDMLIDSANSGQSRAFTDSSSSTGLPSVGNYIKKLFMVFVKADSLQS